MRSWFILCSIIVLAFVLRLSYLDTRGIFTDEKFTLLNANGFWVGGANQTEMIQKKYFTPSDFWQTKNVSDYFESIAHSDFGTHIVYNGILHVWMQIFGNSDYAIRFLSVLFNIFSILLVFFLVTDVCKSSSKGLLAALFLAIEPLNIAMSHLARSYTLSFLLVLGATYLFIKIIRNFENNQKISWLICLYALLTGLCLLNHYLNFLVPLCHAIVFLFLPKKSLKIWKNFVFAGIFNLALMFWWFNWGGGYLSFSFLKDKNEKHLKMAQLEQSSLSAAVQVSTPEVVAKKSLNLLFDSNIISHGVFEHLNGVKNLIFSIFLFLFLVAGIYFLKKRKHWFAVIAFAAAVCIVFFKITFLEGLVISQFFYAAVWFGIKELLNPVQKNVGSTERVLIAICLLMLVLPILFVVYDAFKNGHTTSLTHRYIGVCSPFVAIFIAIGVFQISQKIKFGIFILGILVVLQTPTVMDEIHHFYADNSIKYAWYSPARQKNPYAKAAKKIINSYSPGDTVIIPSDYQNLYQIKFETKNIILYNDAQYLNLYLPKDSKIIQRIDPYEKNKISLIDKFGKKTTIFDLQGSKLRY